MLNSIWLRQPYEFSPMYAQEVSSYLNATAKTLTTAKQVRTMCVGSCLHCCFWSYPMGSRQSAGNMPSCPLRMLRRPAHDSTAEHLHQGWRALVVQMPNVCHCLQINAFVKADTSGRITSVMTQSELAAIDVGVLINAVFFKVGLCLALSLMPMYELPWTPPLCSPKQGKSLVVAGDRRTLHAQSPWQNKFSPVNTIQGNFSLSSSPGAKTVSCNMMNQVSPTN